MRRGKKRGEERSITGDVAEVEVEAVLLVSAFVLRDDLARRRQHVLPRDEQVKHDGDPDQAAGHHEPATHNRR